MYAYLRNASPNTQKKKGKKRRRSNSLDFLKMKTLMDSFFFFFFFFFNFMQYHNSTNKTPNDFFLKLTKKPHIVKLIVNWQNFGF